jgi:hypothetical protein
MYLAIIDIGWPMPKIVYHLFHLTSFMNLATSDNGY